MCAEVAGSPLTELRQIVDTTQDIDYAAWLDDAGLYITDDWQICRVEKPTKAQKAFMKAMQLDK